MRKIGSLLLLGALLCGCSADKAMDEALEVRGRMVSSGCSFRCEITADYIEYTEQFTLECTVGIDGTVEFTVLEPEEISGIQGSLDGAEGTLNFDELILGFPLLADERLSPVAGPWILINTLRSGYITACVREEDGLHLTIDDSYADDALTLEIYLDEAGMVEGCEIGWRGRRQLSMEVEDFAYL